MNISRHLRTYAAALLACVALGCVESNNKNTPQDFDPNKPEKGDWIILHELSDPEGLNPVTTNDASSRDIYTKIFEPLLVLDYQTSQYRPELAETMPTVSDDHLTYTFTLKKNIKFSDGKPLTAKDVIFTIKAIKNPLVIDAAALRNYYESLEDVQATDDYTIVFRMNKPYFMAEFQLGNTYILPKHVFDPKNLTDQYTIPQTNDVKQVENNAAMKEFAEWFGAADRKREPKYMIGSGPYIAEEWRTNEYVRLMRNENYWNKGNDEDAAAYPDKLVYKTVNDVNSAVVALKNSELDMIPTITPPKLWVETIDTVATPHITKVRYAQTIYTYIGWNNRKPYFSDKKVRQALSHLVDRERLRQQVNRGFGQLQNTVIYKNLPEYNSALPAYDFNVEKAKQLLSEAGWKDSDGNGILDKTINGKKTDFTFTFFVNAGNEVRENIALIVSEEMKKVGIKANVQKQEWTVYLENIRSGQFDASIGSWVNDPTPSDPYQLWHSSQTKNKGSNYVGFINARV
ncbi:MAG TPA: ABC transporter substrate-binding protein, partial [Candidatus Kapabacteria bacterium]|nr:ABC transporter substrate-binding protein [Candidatus Kapabacteria bacterium]